MNLYQKICGMPAGGTELADLLWVINGTSSLLPRDLDPDSYAYEVWKCQRAIQEIFIKDLENEEEKILSLLQMPRNRRKSVMDPIMKKLAKFTLFCLQELYCSYTQNLQVITFGKYGVL